MSSNSDNECTRLLSPLQLPRPNRGSPRWQLFPQQRDKDCYGNYNESERENENENDKATENENDDDVRSRRSSRSGGSRSSSQQRQRQRNTQQQQQQQNQQKCIHRDSMISMGPIVGVSKPIKKWYRGIVVRQSCHNRLASDFLARDAHLGTLSVVLTTVTSSAIFASLVPSTTGGMDADADATAYEYEYEYGWSELLAVLAGTIAAFNTVLQGITRTLYYGQWGERHLRAYREYSVLRFQLESIVGDKPLYAEHKVDRNKLEAWIRSYEEVLEESPTIPQKVFDRVASEQDRKGLSWTKDDREVRAIIDEERKLAAIRESKLMSSDPSLFP